MAKILVASFLFICLLQEGVSTDIDIGTACSAGDTCKENGQCIGEKCVKVMSLDGSCSEENTVCNPTSLTCQSDKCKLKAGQDCTSATDKCLANAECTGTTSKKCTCKDGFKASLDNSKCGAMGVAASMLLVVATFLTSRFF